VRASTCSIASRTGARVRILVGELAVLGA